MTRRLFASLAFRRQEPPAVVTDIERLNAFADRYNRYVGALRSGVVDLKLWNDFVNGWRILTNG